MELLKRFSFHLPRFKYCIKRFYCDCSNLGSVWSRSIEINITKAQLPTRPNNNNLRMCCLSQLILHMNSNQAIQWETKKKQLVKTTPPTSCQSRFMFWAIIIENKHILVSTNDYNDIINIVVEIKMRFHANGWWWWCEGQNAIQIEKLDKNTYLLINDDNNVNIWAGMCVLALITYV